MRWRRYRKYNYNNSHAVTSKQLFYYMEPSRISKKTRKRKLDYGLIFAKIFQYIVEDMIANGYTFKFPLGQFNSRLEIVPLSDRVRNKLVKKTNILKGFDLVASFGVAYTICFSYDLTTIGTVRRDLHVCDHVKQKMRDKVNYGYVYNSNEVKRLDDLLPEIYALFPNIPEQDVLAIAKRGLNTYQYLSRRNVDIFIKSRRTKFLSFQGFYIKDRLKYYFYVKRKMQLKIRYLN